MDSHEQLIETLRTIVADVIERPAPALLPDSPIRSIGVDSIALAEIVARIEDAFGIEVPADTWLAITTVGELLDVVAAAIPGGRRAGELSSPLER